MVRQIEDHDLDQIEVWFAARGVSMPELWAFPKTGYIIPGVAAGFLFLTDTPVAIVDCYIASPYADSDKRNDALDIITHALIASARSNGCKIIKCDSAIEAIKNRAIRLGFKSTGSYESFKMEL